MEHIHGHYSHFNLLLRNHWANCNQTLVEWSLDGPLPKMCPVILISSQDGHQAKNRKKGDEILIPLNTGGELWCSGRISSHESGKDQIVIMTNGTYSWSFVTHIGPWMAPFQKCVR
jgi:hypothetical protein